MVVTRRYQMLRPVPCCRLLLSMRRTVYTGKAVTAPSSFMTTCTDLYLSFTPEGYICEGQRLHRVGELVGSELWTSGLGMCSSGKQAFLASHVAC
jgi:hypothetical protein